MNTEPMHRWCDLNRRKKELKDELSEVQSEMDGLDPKIISAMLEEQIPRLPIGGFTLYPKKQTYVKIRETVNDREGLDVLKERLEAEGYGNIVKPLTVSLKALVKSLTSPESISSDGDDGGERELPLWLSSAIEITTETKLAARKA